MNRIVLLSTAMSAVMLTGCASVTTGAEEVRAQLASGVPDAWAVATQGEAVKAGIAGLEDAALSALVAEALAANANLQAAAARVEEARALTRLARSGLWPQASMALRAEESGQVSGGDSSGALGFGVDASWEADVWGRVASQASAAEARTFAVQADLDAARQVLAVSVAEAYIIAIEAKLQTAVAERTFDALSETLSFIEVQYARGLRSGQDIALIRADVASTRAQLEATRAAERDALRALQILLGRMDGSLIEIAPVLPELPDAFDVGVPTDLLVNRPDLLAAEGRVRAALSDLDTARAATLPRLTLAGGISSREEALSGLFDPDALAWSVLSELAAPLLDGGARTARKDASRAALSAAVADYREQAISAVVEVDRQLDRGAALRAQEAAVTDALAEAEAALGFVSYRFEVGDGDLFDVLSVQGRVSSLESQAVSLRRARIEQYLRLSLALGRAG